MGNKNCNQNKINIQDKAINLHQKNQIYPKQQKHIYQMKSDNIEYIRSSPTIIEKIKNNLNELESYLYDFFRLILMTPEKAKNFGFKETEIIRINKNDSKIYVNYYDIIKSEVYIDLSLPVDEIVSKIFGQIFYPYFVKRIHKREQNFQTIEYIMSNPIYELNEEESLFNYNNFLYFEFKGNKLSTLSKLKEGDELYLKISNNIYKEINTFPKRTTTFIKYRDKIFGTFIMSEKGICFGEFKKIFNFNNYMNIHSVNDRDIEYNFDLEQLSIIKGGADAYDFMFIDPSNSNIKELKESKNAPEWRVISEGLNIFGICGNNKCKAHNKEVIFRTLKDRSSLPEEGLRFNMIENICKIKCPICNKIFRPKTCGFYNCEYQFIGIKIENGEVESYNSNQRKTNKNKFEYFEPKGKNEVRWAELKIYVLPIQKIEYKL